MRKLLMLIAAISLLPAYIFAAGDVMEDKTLGEKISKKIEDVKKQKIEKENMKTPAYIGMRKYMEEDDGDGLRKYIANYHKSGKHITEDDFYDIYDVKKKGNIKSYGQIKQHKLCYAIAYNKVNAGKAIIDAGQYPKEGCRRYVNKIIDPYNASKNKYYYLDITKEEVSSRIDENKVQENLPVDRTYTISENEELTCYALEKGLIPQKWLLYDKFPVPALCKEDWRRQAQPSKERKEIKELTEKGKVLAKFGVSENKWRELLEQRNDGKSFAKQSIDIILELPNYINVLPNNKINYYEHDIKKLDNAYKEYVQSLAGIEVPENAKENYEFTKKILEENLSLCKAQIAEDVQIAEVQIAQKREAEAKERAKILTKFGVSEEQWRELLEQRNDGNSFAEQSIGVLSRLPICINLSANDKKNLYENEIKKLDRAYKNYVLSLDGGSVPEKAKENYEYTKQILKNELALVDTEIAEMAEEKKKADIQAREENRRNKLEKLLEYDNDKVEMFLKILGKDLDDNKKQFMYFPNGANIECVFYDKNIFNKDYYDYFYPVFIVIYKEHYSEYVGDGSMIVRTIHGFEVVSDPTKPFFEERNRHHITVYNMEGKKIKDEFIDAESVDIKGYEPDAKYELHSKCK